MPMQLPETIALISITVAAASTGLYIREYFLRKKDSELSQKVWLQTKKQSTQLLTAAQAAETEVISQGNYATKKLVSEYKAQLNKLMQTQEKSLAEAQDQLIKYMESLQERSAEFEQASKTATENRINQVFERLETRLSDFLIQSEQKTTSSIELELKAARQLIETYKLQQLKLIDENIIAMMEQTLNLVLGKKLSLKDQLELVYESLEKAKVEKFVV